MITNLKALTEQRRAPGPSVNINQAKQVNVGNEQVNVVQNPE